MQLRFRDSQFQLMHFLDKLKNDLFTQFREVGKIDISLENILKWL